jgi:hypothetical protein
LHVIVFFHTNFKCRCIRSMSEVKWYKKVLGFSMIKGPVEFLADDSLTGKAVRDIHGSDLKKMRMAWLSIECFSKAIMNEIEMLTLLKKRS